MFAQERGIYDRVKIILNKNEIKTSQALKNPKKKARSGRREKVPTSKKI